MSSRNSEVIHSGFYYPNNSLKAKLCVEGNKMLYNFAKKYSIDYKNTGKLIVLNDSKQEKIFFNLLENSKENKIKNVKVLSGKESKKIEPRVKCIKSLWIPSAGIIDSHGVMSKLENISLTRDVNFAYNTRLKSIKREDSSYSLIFDDNEKISSNIVINCAGLWSNRVSQMLDINYYKLEYYKGDYFKCKSIKDLNCLIYPIPSVASLGIHAVLNLNGEVSFGPNIYKVKNIDYNISDQYKKQYVNEINKYIDINEDDIYEDFSGIRPKIKFDGNFNDFVIKNEIGFKNFINLIGIDSPGLTSCLSIAKYVESIII